MQSSLHLWSFEHSAIMQSSLHLWSFEHSAIMQSSLHLWSFEHSGPVTLCACLNALMSSCCAACLGESKFMRYKYECIAYLDVYICIYIIYLLIIYILVIYITKLTTKTINYHHKLISRKQCISTLSNRLRFSDTLSEDKIES